MIILTMQTQLLFPTALFLSILAIGTVGYYMLGAPENTLMDAFYMTVITISTIGYGEVIDLSDSDVGRLFTIFVAISGIGLLTYILSNLTANVVEGQLKETYRRRKMDKCIDDLDNHFIVCGAGRLATQICRELKLTERDFVVIETDEDRLERFLANIGEDTFHIVGDASQDDILVQAGINCAQGIFAATNDDNGNLVISLSAKHLNSNIRVVSRCEDPAHIEKMKKAGADMVVSPAFIGGLKMTSDMIRSDISDFFESVLRDDNMTMRFETILINDRFAGKRVEDLQLTEHGDAILIGIGSDDGIQFAPKPHDLLPLHAKLIVFVDPAIRAELEESFK